MRIASITPRDPLIFRDGRPFGPGTNRAYSLAWPYPSVSAGAVRTVIGKLASPGQENPFRDEAFVRALKEIEVAGPLLGAKGSLYFPRPQDAAAYDAGKRRVVALRPKELSPGEGCDLKFLGLRPVEVTEESKPARMAAHWSADWMAEWLATDGVPPGLEARDSDPGFLQELDTEERVHVSINQDTGTADEGLLFVTRGLSFPPGWSLRVRVETADARFEPDPSRFPVIHPMGGERRLAEFALAETASLAGSTGHGAGEGKRESGGKGDGRSDMGAGGWTAPGRVLDVLRGVRGVRMVLATPALFREGWLPGWVNRATLEGSPPGADPGVRLTLRGACLQRWRPISGWSLEAVGAGDERRRRPGPKPLRRLVPAGAVYFFEVKGGNPERLAESLWLRSVADDVQDRRDGFGLAVWGVWSMEGMRV